MRRPLALLALCAALAAVGAVVAPAPPAGAQDAPALRAQLARAFRGAPAASGAYVRDLTTGRTLFSARASIGRIPASVQKLFTTSTALVRLGPSARLRTAVAGSGFLDPDGVWQGDLYLRGGGDPTLSATGLARLADRVAAAGVVRVQGRVLADESWFDAARGGPATGLRYDRDMGGVLGGLTVGRGFAKRGGPAGAAARGLLTALRRRAGIQVTDGVGAGRVPAGARTLATLPSPTVAALVRATLIPSDNFYAETLLKDLAARPGRPGTTAAGAAVVRRQAAAFGLAPVVADGSGLSRADRVSPRDVVGLLAAMQEEPSGAAFTAGMAVAGRTGTVRLRLRGTAAQDRCRAKTGTLRDVSALAGLCTTAAGHTLAFAFLMNRTAAIWRAHVVQDRMAVALARYDGP
jgi:D-alanyl-D-alanine carboxypeptidase/D-alanyl-D-alanine-endopeptidase (penicillin-binding protein 4)